MDTAWIQVFVLTLSECVAPAGKTVCQEREFELQFLTRADCEFALQQLVELKQESDAVIIDPARSSCKSSARESKVFASLEEISESHGGGDDWQMPDSEQKKPSFVAKEHQERLATLKTCDETGGAAPCRIGEIIIEGATSQDVEVWRRDN